MKRSRIFLAISACFLAIAGVAVAKSTKGPQTAFFLTQDYRATCKVFSAICVHNNIGITCYTIIKNSKGQLIITIAYTNNICIHPLHYLVE